MRTEFITRRRMLAEAAGLALLAAGCGPRRTRAAGYSAALVLDTGGVDDRSFNAAAWAGMQRAMKAFHIHGAYIESKSPADYQVNLTEYANLGSNLVFAIGYKMADALKQVAVQFPHVDFAIVDTDAPDLPNCAGLKFREEEGTFLVGYLAASVSRSRKIGFVGGEDIPLIEKFEAGYRAGAKTADPAVTVISAYTGDWNDLNKGKSQAMQEFGNGADIIFQAAGKAGLGVIEAARERGPGFYAIGVDQDQDYIAPGRVLTSMIKRTDTAVYDMVQEGVSGKFRPGPHIYGLKEDGVGLSDMKYTRQDVPPAVLHHLDTLKAMILAGKIKIPVTLAAVPSFVPPHLPANG